MLKAMLIVTALAGGGDYTTEMSSMKECLDARETIAKQDPNVKTLCVPISDETAVSYTHLTLPTILLV